MPFLSVSVIAPTATETDGLDTAFMVMGKRAVQEYCAKHEGISAVVVRPGADESAEPVVEKIE
jgi:thiamine biosynthesis lipoprotein ApbE